MATQYGSISGCGQGHFYLLIIPNYDTNKNLRNFVHQRQTYMFINKHGNKAVGAMCNAIIDVPISNLQPLYCDNSS